MSDGHRALGCTVLALATLAVVLHVLGARGAVDDPLWGVHTYAFFPPWILLAATVALGLTLVFARGPEAPIPRALQSLASRRSGADRSALPLVAASLLAGGVFWFARARHTLLGDGNVIVASLPQASPFHAHGPLSASIDYVVFHALQRFAPGGLSPSDLAERAVALVSVLAGVLFVPCAWGLATELIALTPGAQAARQARRAETWLLGGILLCQGYAQLFCGYVENYSFFLLAVGVYLWLSLRFLAGRSPFVLPACAALVGMGLHLSAGMVLPSLLLLAGVGACTSGRRRGMLRDVLLVGAAVAVLGALLARLGHGYRLGGAFLDVAREALLGGMRHRLAYMVSRAHLRDFSQEQLLIGPLGLAVFLPALGLAAVALRRGISSTAAFLMLLGLSWLGASWLAGDSNLGYARNWDLLASGGLVFTVAGVGYFMLRGEGNGRLAPILVWALALSLYHTVPWILVNASEERGVERMKTLPLGGGRSEMVVGNWYLRHGQLTNARWWLERSFASYSNNVSTCYLLGTVYSLQDETERALEVLGWGSELRPDDPGMRRRLIETLVAAGRREETLPHFDKLLRLPGATCRDWALQVDVLAALGRREAAAEAREKALAVCEAALPGSTPGDSLQLLIDDLRRPIEALGR